MNFCSGIQTDDLFKTCLFLISGFRRLRRSFSKCFDILGTNDIGLFEVTRSDGLPSFNSTIICAFFHCYQTYFVRTTALNIYVRIIITFFGNFLSIRGDHVPFFGLLLMSFQMQLLEVGSTVFFLVPSSGFYCIIIKFIRFIVRLKYMLKVFEHILVLYLVHCVPISRTQTRICMHLVAFHKE